MMIYLNSEQKLPIGSKIEVPEMMVLYQELIHATAEAYLDKKANSESYTYAAIIDEPIHDPLVQRQINAVYTPNPLGLYPVNKKGGLTYDKMITLITNVKSSIDVFLYEPLLKQIRDIGFNGVWVFDNHSRQIITLKDINALIIKKL